MALNEKQSTWMYKELDVLYQKYYKKLPFSQEVWEEFKNDMVALDKLCKGEKYKDGREMIFSLAEYFNKLNTHGNKPD